MGYGAFLASALLLFLFPRDFYAALLIAAIFGVYDGIVNTITRALIPKYSESALRGTAYGLYYLIVGSCLLIANITVGALWQSLGPSAAAAYSITLAAASIVGMAILLGRRKPGQHRIK